MIRLDKQRQAKIHTRAIEVATYEGSTGGIVVEGVLKDDRLLDSYLISGEVRPPGTVHHMIVRMAVSLPDLYIGEIEVDMPTTPHDACIETRRCLEPVVGLRIAAGFTAQVKRRVGGPRGCVHLLSLLTAMASAAFQGAWSATVREPVDPAVYRRKVTTQLKNTCRVWRADGPLMRQWRDVSCESS